MASLSTDTSRSFSCTAIATITSRARKIKQVGIDVQISRTVIGGCAAHTACSTDNTGTVSA